MFWGFSFEFRMVTHFLLHYGPWEDMVCASNVILDTITIFAGDRPSTPAGQQAGLPAQDRGGGLDKNQAGA